MILPKKIFHRYSAASKNLPLHPASLVSLTITSSFIYIFLEWIFIFTRPSYLRTVPFGEKFAALTSSAGLIIYSGLLILLPILLLLCIRQQKGRSILSAIAILIPTILLALTLLLLVDNFTYTVFHFGIISTRGVLRALYAVLLILLTLYLYPRMIEFAGLLSAFFSRQTTFARRLPLVIVLLLSAAAVLLPANFTPVKAAQIKQTIASSRNTLPDILLITVDGVNAEYTSIYGGERDTTPFLRELAQESFLAENDFANAQGTIGAITSLLSGKYPADTRVIYSSDMLQGLDAYQHLPGILNTYGYYTAQLSNEVYADAYKTNFQSAFDEANGRSTNERSISNVVAKIYPGVTSIFQQEVLERISDRLAHIFFLRDMTNPYKQVTEAPQKFDDAEKIDQVKEILESKREPVFIHLHWMGTHGPNYYPEQQVFSSGMDLQDQELNKQLFYFDSILEFDRAMAELYQFLADNNRLNHTILVITSDHSQKWTNSRLPLLIHFPSSVEKNRIASNVENVDVAPTLLDYLGIQQPAWMPGQSLITGDYQTHPIITAKIPKSTRDDVTGKVVYPESKPPFYQFGRMSVIVCDQWFELDLTDLTTKSGSVAAYSTPCASTLTTEQAIKEIANYFDRYGFDVHSLEELITSNVPSEP